MAEYRLARRVSEVADRMERLQSLNTRSAIWLIGATLGLSLAAVNHWGETSLIPTPVILSIAVVLLFIGWRTSRRRQRSLHEAAIAIEHRWPDLDSRLVTAIDQRPEEGPGGFSFLQHEVITETLLHSHRHDWLAVVPSSRLNRARLQHVACLLMFAIMFAGAVQTGHARSKLAKPVADSNNTADPGDEYGLSIDPGDVEIERGSDLVVMARFDGRTPDEVILQATDASGKTLTQALSRSLDDPLFGCRLAAIETDLSYHITFDGIDSDAYQVTVFEYPQLLQADATVVHPEYTGLDDVTIEDVRRLSVIEGSQVTLQFLFNKPVAYAALTGEGQREFELTSLNYASDCVIWTVTLSPQEKQTFMLDLVDEVGRENKDSPEFVIDVIPNQPPELAITFPGRDVKVSPLEEMSIEADAHDDFGLQEVGLIYQLPGQEEKPLKLGDHADANAIVSLAHQMAMEEVEAQPNDLVSYYFYADDIGPDGHTRRTFSDLYFAEIRHFDEEYREGQSPPSQGGPPPGNTPADKLLELQRDIVNAIWTVIRRERGEKTTAEFADDVQMIDDSQRQALGIARELMATLEDALSQQHAGEAIEHMTSAAESLSSAVETDSTELLPGARTSAYDAYRALLKLQAREHVVSRSQSGSQSSSQSSRQQLNEQLQQLELKNDRNRYENESQEQPAADREQLQVLNRLRELARRQSGINDKIQELENALREAETDEEKEEIERQLKRLREEQQELMRDLDELEQRMNREQNRQQMAEARQQAMDVRENLRRTSEALEQGQLSRALSSGTRAERELEEMKEELREQTAGQFADAMRELRDDVQQMADQQEQLRQDLAGEKPSDQEGPRQLKDDGADDLQERVDEQREELARLLEQIKQVVEESELSEPLLSKTLYDAIRKTRVDRPDEALEMTAQFLRHGLDREAVRAEAQARMGIEKLQAGVEKAASSVLGNEVGALRRAQGELEELAESIRDELADATPKEDTSSESGEAQSSTDTEQSSAQSSNQSSEENQSGSAQAATEPSDSNSSSSKGLSSETPSRSSTPRELSSFLEQAAGGQPGGGPASGGPHHPLTGTDFIKWSDRMRDVEEMVDDPELRSNIAQIRDRARQMRIDLKRDSKLPNWDLVKTSIYGPMLELQQQLAEEIARRAPSDDVVPIDCDPVPDRYTDLVERYYERLGSGR